MHTPLPRNPVQLALVATGVALAVGCSEPPVASEGATRPALTATSRERPHHADEYLANVADRVPGFTGFYVRHDTLVLTFKDAPAATAASAALRQNLRNDPDIRRFQDVPRLLDYMFFKTLHDKTTAG